MKKWYVQFSYWFILISLNAYRKLNSFIGTVSQDRYLLAPTPPLVLTMFDMNMESFLSPTSTEPTSDYNAPSPATIIAASFQSDHRHVTPMPVATLSPVPPPTCDSIEITNSPSNGTIIDTTDSMTVKEQKEDGSIDSNQSITSEKSTGHALSLAGDIMYKVSALFPVKVHRMITETYMTHGRSLMHWTDCGKYFWIEQKHTMLSSVLSQHFNRTFALLGFFKVKKLTYYLQIQFFVCIDNRYQSLRRQLNAYGFGKSISGQKKGYWKHPKFCRDCTLKTLKSIVAESRNFGQKKKDAAKRAALSAVRETNHTKTVENKKKLKLVPVKAKSLSSIQPDFTKRLIHNNKDSKSTVNPDKAYTHQIDDSYANKFYSGTRRQGMPNEEESEVEEMNGMASNTLHIDDPFLAEPIPDFGYEIPPFLDDSSSDALTALATVASFLPIAPMPLYTPIVKNLVSTGITAALNNQASPAMNVVSPQDIKMTILTEAAFWFCPTPIKVPTVTSCDQLPNWNDSIDCCFDDAMSSYSTGSLSSPMKLILPFSDRSAFTPIISSTDHMVAEFCESFH
jgi:hypothetical protein